MCDAKILAKCSAHRIKKDCQILLVFLHGRYIGDDIRQVLETIEYYEISETPGLVFIVDFEKVFDKV